jgi:hypothetical protein
MPTSFFQYEMLPTTWFYVSTLIILAMFFKFNRFWSVRNVDLIGLIMLTPGLLMLAMTENQWGYLWLFSVGLFLLIRLFFDTVMVRRPLLEPNLTPGGLTFACFFLFFFIVASITVNRGDQIDTVRTVRLEQILTTRHIQNRIGMNPTTLTIPLDEIGNLPPGFLPFLAFSERTSLALAPPEKIRNEIVQLPRPVAEPLDTPISARNPVLNPMSNSMSNPAATPISNPTLNLTLNPNPTLNLTLNPTLSPEANSDRTSSEPQNVVTIIPQPTLLSEQPILLSEQPNPNLSTIPPSITLPITDHPTGSPQPDLPALRPNLSSLSGIMAAAMLGHLAIVFGFIYIGHCHFGNIQTGIACATLYLLHPYTNQMVGRLDHLIPAALMLWSIALYRRPFWAGLGIGTAAALVLYPICLVPLWCSFYWRRGWIRFLCGSVAALTVFAILLLFSPPSLGTCQDQIIHMLGKSMLKIFSRADGFWSYHEMIYRVPLLAIFFTLCFGMILWPAHKHFATLLSCSALLMLGIQFWQIHQGGLYMAWYLPLLILTIFRPNLEDRTAIATVVP